MVSNSRGGVTPPGGGRGGDPDEQKNDGHHGGRKVVGTSWGGRRNSAAHTAGGGATGTSRGEGTGAGRHLCGGVARAGCVRGAVPTPHAEGVRAELRVCVWGPRFGGLRGHPCGGVSRGGVGPGGRAPRVLRAVARADSDNPAGARIAGGLGTEAGRAGSEPPPDNLRETGRDVKGTHTLLRGVNSTLAPHRSYTRVVPSGPTLP